MRFLLLISVVVIVGYFIYKNASYGEIVPEVKLTGMSSQQAVENVKKLPEVQEYLKRVPNGKVEVDNELEGEYNVHVYEVKNGHTATFNWYRVSIKSGEIRSEFKIP